MPWGGTATLLLEAKRDEDTVWCVVNPEHCSPDNRTGLHGEPRPHLKFHALGLDPSAVAKAPNDTLALNAGAALRAVEMASALSRAMDMCVEYTRERVKFGRPLAKFQAIQQQLAVLASLSTQARVAARRAFVALDSGSSDFVVANAKSAVGQAASQGAAIAHQSHGAMGFTAEYGLHRLTRRIWTWREDFGNELYWSTQVGKHVANAGADGLWGLLPRNPNARRARGRVSATVRFAAFRSLRGAPPQTLGPTEVFGSRPTLSHHPCIKQRVSFRFVETPVGQDLTAVLPGRCRAAPNLRGRSAKTRCGVRLHHTVLLDEGVARRVMSVRRRVVHT